MKEDQIKNQIANVLIFNYEKINTLVTIIFMQSYYDFKSLKSMNIHQFTSKFVGIHPSLAVARAEVIPFSMTYEGLLKFT